MAGKKPPDPNIDDPREAVDHDGGIIGNPGGYRYATGGRKPDAREAAEEMLRGRHRGGSSPHDR